MFMILYRTFMNFIILLSTIEGTRFHRKSYKKFPNEKFRYKSSRFVILFSKTEYRFPQVFQSLHNDYFKHSFKHLKNFYNFENSFYII